MRKSSRRPTARSEPYSAMGVDALRRVVRGLLDEKFDQAVGIILAEGRCNTALLQRRLGLGYTRAAAVCDQLEMLRILGPYRSGEERRVLVTPESWRAFRRVFRKALRPR